MTLRIFRNPNFLVGFIIVVVIVAAAIGYTAWQESQADGSNTTGEGQLVARVHDGDGTTTDVPLNVKGKRNIQSSLGTNVLMVEDGAIHVESATCANKDCIHQGAISEPGQQIICLPNKMWVEIVHEGDADGTMDETKTPDYAGGDSSLDATAR